MREITKIYEQTVHGNFETVLSYFQENPAKGEIVIVLSTPEKQTRSSLELDSLLKPMLEKLSLRDASDLAAKILGVSKKQVYQRALILTN